MKSQQIDLRNELGLEPIFPFLFVFAITTFVTLKNANRHTPQFVQSHLPQEQTGKETFGSLAQQRACL